MRIAEDALADTFTLQRVRGQQPRQEDGKINWSYRGPRDDKEWAWMLNRHGYFISLVHAWKHTGDTRYLVRLDNDLYDWLQQHTFPGRLTFSPAWRA
ncbi:heparinase II/III family protein, partial [Arthrospira platensis SPKY1]|nr:heparinase II/III family protein [Arthrospira platensis SPKY1]